MSELFAPLTLRGTTFRNRAWVTPMCQYSSVGGMPADWHLVHLGALAGGGAGLVIVESTAVSPQGRISPADTGIWSDEHADGFRRITDFAHGQGAAIGLQISHAGRKASTAPPWLGGGAVPPAEGGWQTEAPSPVSYDAAKLPAPRELTTDDIAGITADFAAAAARAAAAGFDVLEIHGAHGYLLHEFLSPLSNLRTDAYGGSFEGRIRFPLEVVAAVRAAWPEDRPLFFRTSATDWTEGGWTLEDTLRLASLLAERGVDLLDCSSGGNVAAAEVPAGPGYQVPFAATVRRETAMPTAAVGLITEPRQAEKVVADGEADAVLLGRELLRNPHWPLLAAAELGGQVRWPEQYQRATG